MILPEWLRAYGDVTYRGRCPTESAEQIAFFDYIRIKHSDIASIAIHQRNEGARSYGQAKWHKREGLTKGAADIIIPAIVPFVCELKRKDHTQSKWAKGQLDYLRQADARGAYACVAFGFDACVDAFNQWLWHVDYFKQRHSHYFENYSTRRK